MSSTPPPKEETAAQRPVETIFGLLSILRAGKGSTSWQLRRELHRRGSFYLLPETPYPRLDFWLRLAKTAGLLDAAHPPQPTLLIPDWLALPPLDRLRLLLDAWLRLPLARTADFERRQALNCLMQGKHLPARLAARQLELFALGLADAGQLTPWGRALLLNQPSHPVMLPQPWRLEGEKLIVPYPPDWSLLWELERFVWPTGPGEYLLGESAIQDNAQHAGFSHFGALVQTLEGGLKHSLPPLLRAALQPEPALQVMHGVILAFEQPSAIIELRRLRSWRKDLANLLSSRHVLIQHSQARRILQKLASKGLLSTTILQASLQELGLVRKADHQAAEPRLKLDRADQAFLLTLVHIVRQAPGELGWPLPPPGLEQRLSQGLPPGLLSAALKRAERTLELQSSQRQLAGAFTPAQASPEASLLENLQQAIDREQALDILYQAVGRESAEPRRITPLLLERRGSRHYLLAYCHTRRANRTFRLDRLELLQENIQANGDLDGGAGSESGN